MREVFYSNDMTIFAEIHGKGSNGKTLFWVCYSGQHSGYEEHEIKLYEWAKHLHGNAPSGTPYGYIRASRNGKRIIITV